MSSTKSLTMNDANSWQQLTPSLATDTTCAFPTLCVNSKGILYGGQNITNSSSAAFISANLATWDNASSTWISLGGTFNNNINCICADTKGNIYVAGDFTDGNGCCNIAKYNPALKTWSLIANPLIKNPIQYICTDSSGNFYVVGNFRNSNNSCYVAMYSPGNGWTELTGGGFGNNSTVEICYGSGNLYALENISNPDNSTSCFLKIWNKSTQKWTIPANPNITSSTTTLCYNDGSVYVLNNDSTVSTYNITTSTWTKTAAMPNTPAFSACLIFAENLLYVASYTSGYVSFLYCYDFTSLQWTEITSSKFSSASVFMSACSYSENMYLGGTFNFVLEGTLV